jgi:ferredoxin
VVILDGEVSAPSSEERENLTPDELRAGIRLACCTRLHSSVKVLIGDQSGWSV